jgi:hypothetical protein
MLVTSLVLSSVLWLIANRVVYGDDRPWLTVIPAAVGFGLLALMACFLPAVALQAVLLIIVLMACSLLRLRPRSFLLLSSLATVAAYPIVAWLALQYHERLVEQFPYVSMEERLPQAPPRAGALAAAAARHLDYLEAMIESEGPHTWSEKERVSYLRQLHEDTVGAFIQQEGFGYARMPRVSAWALKAGLREDPALPQPGSASTSRWSAADLLEQLPPEKKVETERDLLYLHEKGVVDFVNPSGFGFFKDRRHVAGFQPHQFSEVPATPERWALRTLDLIGLAMHEKPVAYVSANLPRMDELREAPTRPPDAFEAAGLAALRRGETLFIRHSDGGLRALGAIRSVRQCISCHGGARGDLLGAFSYAFAGVKPQ